MGGRQATREGLIGLRWGPSQAPSDRERPFARLIASREGNGPCSSLTAEVRAFTFFLKKIFFLSILSLSRLAGLRFGSKRLIRTHFQLRSRPVNIRATSYTRVSQRLNWQRHVQTLRCPYTISVPHKRAGVGVGMRTTSQCRNRNRLRLRLPMHRANLAASENGSTNTVQPTIHHAPSAIYHPCSVLVSASHSVSY